MQPHNRCWQCRTVFKQPRTTKAITDENTKIKDDACRRSPVPFSSLLSPNFVKEIFTLHSLEYSKIFTFSTYPSPSPNTKQSLLHSSTFLFKQNSPLAPKTKHYNCWHATLKDLTAAHHIPTDGMAKKVGSKEQTAENIFDHSQFTSFDGYFWSQKRDCWRCSK